MALSLLSLYCVKVGDSPHHTPQHVARLRDMLRLHLLEPYRLYCVTDRISEIHRIDGVEAVPLDRDDLPRWWAKMRLFDPALRGRNRPALYLDLDTVILGDLSPLTQIARDTDTLAMCRNFAHEAGATWRPGRYGSCCTALPPGWGAHLWEAFSERPQWWRAECDPYGDQLCIERIATDPPTILQDRLPSGFFLNYRDVWRYPEAPPPEARVVVFGGRAKPHRSGDKEGRRWPQWLTDAYHARHRP